MSILETKKIEPATGTTVTLGAAGETVAIGASQLKTNTIKDAGGNTILTSDGSGTLSNVNSAIGPTMVLISSQDGSGSSQVNFTSGIDSTYDVYMFVFVNIHPQNDGANFWFQAGSSYNTTITSCYFRANHGENNAGGTVAYAAANDLNQETGWQILFHEMDNDNDSSVNGILYLYSPSSTTYVKNWYCTTQGVQNSAWTQQCFSSGYFNTTSAISQVGFKCASGNMESGTIYLYGMK